MKYLKKLPPNTQSLLNALEPELLTGFLLVGGTGLALHIGHRISEDLDLMTRDPQLPGRQLDRLLSRLKEKHFVIERLQPDDALLLECDRAGDDPEKIQRRYLIGETKIDFFVADPNAQKMLDPTTSFEFRLASVKELFRLKCLLPLKRTASRDIYDLYRLFHDHGFTAGDLEEALSRSTYAGSEDYLWTKLCQPTIPEDDPGYNHLVDTPIRMEDIGNYFSDLRLEQVKKAARNKS
jgi:hypothetical protein